LLLLTAEQLATSSSRKGGHYPGVARRLELLASRGAESYPHGLHEGLIQIAATEITSLSSPVTDGVGLDLSLHVVHVG
jgi:hypothetical protein